MCKTVLSVIPEKYRTEDICKKAILNNYWAIDDVPHNVFSKEFVLFALSNVTLISLTSIPLEYRTKDICTKAIDNNVCNINHIPEELMDTKLCIQALKGGIRLLSIPYKFRTWDVCFEAVKKDGLDLKEVPREMKRDELICKTAVQQNKDAIYFVDKSIRDEIIREINNAVLKKDK